jgi:hypothetical protein
MPPLVRPPAIPFAVLLAVSVTALAAGPLSGQGTPRPGS